MAQEWFYTQDGKNKIGPISSAELKALAESGQVLPTDMVLKAGMVQWTTASTIKGLWPTAKSIPTTSPPPEIGPGNSAAAARTKPADVLPRVATNILGKSTGPRQRLGTSTKIAIIAGVGLLGCLMLMTIVLVVVIGWRNLVVVPGWPKGRGDEQGGQTKKTDEERLFGTWKITKHQHYGFDQPLEELLAVQWTFAKNGKLRLRNPGEQNGTYEVLGPGELNFALDEVDFTKCKAIFKFEGDDKLTLCFNGRRENVLRPMEFKSDKDNGNTLWVLGRTDPGDKVPPVDVATVRERAESTARLSALKQLATAMHNYHDVYGGLPAHAIYSKDGKTPLLSWRVAILPFIENTALYNQFKLDEPWDSAHNKKLIPNMPTTYATSVKGKFEPVLTFFQVFSGPGTIFDGPKKMTFKEIKDGRSNTIMIIEAKEPVIWTKPADLKLPKENDKFPAVGGVFKDRMHLAFCDASALAAHNVQDPALMRALVTPNGGETVDLAKLKQAK